MRKMEYEELEQILNERKDNEKLELRDLEFDDMDLSDRDLHNIDFEVCMFCNVKLDGADLSESSVKNAQLDGCSLRSVNFQNAEMWGACMRGCDMTGCNICGANLYAAVLENAILTDVKADENTKCIVCDVRRQERLLHTKNVYMIGLCNCWFRRTPNALHPRIRPAGVIRRKCLRSKALMKQKNLMKRGLW